MPVPTDQLAGDIDVLTKEVKDVSKGLVDLRTEFVVFRERIDTHLAYIKWIGVFIAGLLVAVVGGSGRVVWEASALHSELKQQGTRIEKVESEVKQQGTRVERVEKRLDGVEGRLGSVEGRLDGIAKELEILIRRTEPKPGG
jgi:hypothetical protein